MLERLFSRSLPRYATSAHAADLDAFAVLIQSHGQDNRRTERHTRRLLWVLEASLISPNATVDINELRDAFAAWPRKGYVGTFRLYCGYLQQHDRLIAVEPCQPRFALKVEHLRRLVDLNGIAPATVIYDNWALTDFLSRVLEPDQEPAAITRKAVDEFFEHRRPQLARRTFHHTVHVVRRYLRYAFDCGALHEPLHLFELPQSFRFEQPPRALPAAQIEALLASIDQSGYVGRRDHAILHLMATYGLRPGEVAALKRSSIDWRSQTLRVMQSKTRSVLTLPMTATTVRVLGQYVELPNVVRTHDELFCRPFAPFGPMSAPAVSLRFKVHARRAGLPIASASAYALRHTFAMKLLAAGVGMKQIGDLLGHSCLASTSAYLRIQTDMLREVALEVPSEVAP